MNNIKTLNELIEFNSSFKSSINLYLSLNKIEKILGYIPTKSSIGFMGDYIKAVLDNKEQATLLVGPYGKGKSHLLLVLLAILSLERTEKNGEIINQLIEKIKSVDEIGDVIAKQISDVWNLDKFLPVLITDTTGDLNQAFLYGLNDALKREGLTELIPNTYYAIALNRLTDWEKNYPETYRIFETELHEYNETMTTLKSNLKMYSKQALSIFEEIYPKVTAGSKFSPMAVSAVLPLYKSTAEKLVEEYGYSGIYIVFDEFSKFIESQVGNTVGSNMKLIQDICELATDSQNAQIYFTMVAHKSIKEYGKFLPQEIINSFTGIEGRIIEKYFVTSSKNNYELIKNAIIKNDSDLESIPHSKSIFGKEALKKYYQIPAFKSQFLENEFNNIILRGCYPLNPVASYLLLNVSEKVAQNERTLFTFISNDEPNSMARYVAEHTSEMEWSIGADLIYDYFSSLFKNEVSNEYVHNIWLSAQYALEKCITDDEKKIIKALAIVLIVNKEDEIPSSEKYLKLCINATDATQAISQLVQKDLIYRKRSTGNYVFKTKAGSELKLEIKRKREIKGENVNYAQALMNVTSKYYIIPRKYNTIHMMTRYFANQYMEVEDFLNVSSAKALLGDCLGDGKVITLFSFDTINQDDVIQHLMQLAEPKLVVICPKKEIKIQKQLKDYEIINEIKENNTFTSNNEILKNELPLLIEDLTDEMGNVLSEIYEENLETKVFYFNSEEVKFEPAGEEETVVNWCCENIYTKTPVINNEMVNRTTIGTSQTKKARLNIIKAILDHQDTEDYYIGSNQEATIYRALFCATKIKEGTPLNNIQEVLETMDKFIDSCSDQKRLLADLIEKLTHEPFGMRAGIIPIYFAYIISKRREDIIVYFANNEIEIQADIVVNMCENPRDYSLFVSKDDLLKEKYISGLNMLFQVEDNRNLSENRIKDIFICMQRWFRALPQSTRNLISISEYVESERLIRAMKKIKKSMQLVEFNPFEILFVEFPKAFKTSSLPDTFDIIKECKVLFDDYFDWLQSQVSDKIYDVYDEKRKQDLYHTLKEWYESQSKCSKQGLYDGRVTSYMSSIETLEAYSDFEVARKIAKAITDVYIENWNTKSLEKFNEDLIGVKREIETIRDEVSTGEMQLSFTRKNGELFEKTYSYADESTGAVFRNIIEDTLDDFDDLSVNDRVSILLEMIEKITK